MPNNWSIFIANIKKEKLLSVSNILIMTVTFVLLGLLINIVVFSQTALRYLEDQAQVTVFFKDDFTEAKIGELKDNLSKDKRVSALVYVSKEDALRIFREINKDEPVLLESVSASILPASLEVRAGNISNLKPLAEELKIIDGVEEVRYFEDVVSRFKFWSTVVYIVGTLLVLTFLVISYSVIIAALRTTINSRGVEFEIMKIVGASDDYVKVPLVHHGVFFGLFSSSIASVIMILLGVGITLTNVFPKGLGVAFLPGVFIAPWVFSIILTLILLLSGFLLGYLGSSAAIKKYLNY
ncbi:MAG: Cell division protein FtsX [candidate division WWE3 bacterium GW2011_GWF2_41_45]|uniref:Cell division protein FtsX n=2 Tax=Katanobacteria TaxID=422282 RepID=A0A0G0VSP3_UNCKA|nr:MAG: Cell division protein FtsX [candidate division WWE3 bacterium GW2011_GWC2_41_23]KKS09988.1 MAG: Cell division protein FtsX [candidate division WWE3 bacterium GW2011_GWF2_41_45]KKS11948.1 MAG: Cell division protein FtsX [candidate division WWE3 bacterium GW2011_GWF1_41_53]KKS19838.1 MAG: Cell division protein FtsX [candidate division WWE3 bacterium GW2011_GWE1_41_72]KKS28279.1 MAG: Cell division protein FtsX [candidate division WWE3 bacterium GW2011_GWD2_42_11]KKS50310.1 MAG: Cell divis